MQTRIINFFRRVSHNFSIRNYSQLSFERTFQICIKSFKFKQPPIVNKTGHSESALKETEILKIDARGRIVIPRGMRRSLGLKENSFIMLISDPDNNEIKIVPLTFSENQSFIKLKILIPDKAGALGLIANVFGELGLSLVYGQTVVIKKGVDAEWSVISPVPENITVEELTKVLMEKGGAIKVTIEPSLVNNE